jgi:hypothetical protein
MSRHALRRAGAVADGWLGQFALDTLSESEISGAVDTIKREAKNAGRAAEPRVVIRITGAATQADAVAARLRSIESAGATEVIVDVDWNEAGGPARGFKTLSAGLN